MQVRRADINDLALLTKLFDQYRIFYNYTSDLRMAHHFLQERMEKNESVVYVAEASDNELAGFVQLYPLFSSTRMSRLWLLNDLFVHENFRMQGVATKLTNAAKQLCRETNACGFLLETAKGNNNANNLYLKEGLILDAAHNYYTWNNE